MDSPTLEDRLRQTTKHFTSRLPEDEVFRLGEILARAIARAHEATPPRHPAIEPSRITMNADVPDLAACAQVAGPRESLFELGALLLSLATGERPRVSWRLDPPKAPALSNLLRRTALDRLLSPRADTRFETAAQACEALGRAASTTLDSVTSAWPMFRGSAERCACRTSPPAPRSLAPLWDAFVGATVASPLVVGPLVVTATVDGRVVFVDRESGRIAHVVHLGAPIESSPAVSGDQILVGTDAGELVSIDLRSGEVASRMRIGDIVRSSPLPTAHRTFVGTIEGRDSGGLVALAPDTKRILWRRKLGSVFSSPALAGERVILGTDDGRLVAVEPEGGAILWSATLEGKVRSTPAIGGGRAFVGTFAGRVAAIDLETGSVAWSREVGENVYSSPALAGELVAVGCHDGAVHGFGAQDGAPRFRTLTRGPVVASPLAVGDAFIVASTDGGLYLIDCAGTVRARHALPGDGAQSSAALDADELWVGSSRGLHALKVVS